MLSWIKRFFISKTLQKPIYLRVAARASPLSRAQVNEVWQELRRLHSVIFLPRFLETTGDRDQTTSLRTLEKTDFFTREIDALILSGQCDVGIHSAKDLPDPLPPGLEIFAMTKGVDPADSLVLRRGDTLETLPRSARIATSSPRREEAVRRILPYATFTDLRGPIDQRLSLLHKGEADGVVVAEAALIRLRLTDLNRWRLPGETAPLQGQLAVVGRRGDSAFQEVFSSIDVNQRSHPACPASSI